MILTIKTKQYFILAALIGGTAFAAAAYLLVQVRQQGQELEANLAIITENNVKAAAYARIEQQISQSVKERATLATAFLESGASGPDFLTTLEAWGAAYGLTIEVLSLEEVPSMVATGKTELQVTFAYDGTQTAVLAFTQLLEALPYHARLESLQISGETTGNKVRAEVDLRITIYPTS